MTSYVCANGYSISLANARASDNAINSTFKTAISNSRLVTLFLDGFNIVGNSGHKLFVGYDTVTYTEYSGRHAMVAYGYKEVTYKNSSGVIFRQDMYLNVMTGYSENAWIRISSDCTLDFAYVVGIS